MTKKQFIAELTSSLKQYDESNLIDYRSVWLWVQTKLKRFGSNIMTGNDKFLKVENGKAKLPENFWKLDLAVKCDPEGYNIEGNVEQVITSDIYRIRVEEDNVWNNSIEGYLKKDYKQIIEKVILDSNIINYHYKSPTILKLTKGFNRENCVNTCKNLQNIYTNSSPWEINIINNYIQTNFSKGYIYIQYTGLPTDENGELIIPETQHSHLQEYLMYHCKAKIMEDLMGNGDEPNLINMYNLYSAKEKEYFSLAMTEAKFSGLSHDWDKKLKNKMRSQTMKFENMFPKN